MESSKMDSKTIAMAVFGGLEIALIITAIWMFSRLVGTADTANNLSATVMPISFTLGAIIIVHTVLWYMYFQYEPMAMNLYFLITGSLTMFFSVVAISISLIQRS